MLDVEYKELDIDRTKDFLQEVEEKSYDFVSGILSRNKNIKLYLNDKDWEVFQVSINRLISGWNRDYKLLAIWVSPMGYKYEIIRFPYITNPVVSYRR